MKILKAFVMALGMFTVIPLPKNIWDMNLMRFIMPIFPFVGLCIGSVWCFTSLLIVNGSAVSAAVIAILPFALSGFIHVDGLMDTSDAIFSRRDLSEKRRILKDSTVGAFAVISAICLFLFCFAAALDFKKEYLAVLIFIPILSRSIAALALLNLKSISQTGYGAGFKAGTSSVHSAFIFVCIVISFVLALLLALPIAPLVAVVLTATLTAIFTYKELDGFSGDLCGATICFSEMCGLICLALL